MSAGILERLVVKVLGDEADFNRMTKQVIAGANKMSKQMTRVGRQLSKGVTAPMTAMGAVTVASFAKFDDSMTKSTAIMGDLSDSTRKAMEQQALTLSTQGVSSASELADAYFFLASAGMNAEQQMAALPQVQAFAAAGAFDLATATDLATDAQSALGLASADAQENLVGLTRVTDVLLKANTLANASAEQFSRALTRKAGTALRNTNKSIEEGVAVLGVYADQGIKSANAGEKLSTTLLELQMRARTNATAFKKWGVEVANGDGSMRNIADIIEDFEGQIGNLSVTAREAALAELGLNREAQAAIVPLLGMSQRIRQLQKELEAASGITKEVAEKQLASLTSQLTITSNILNAVAIDIGSMIAPAVVFLNEMLQKLALAWFELDDVTKGWVITIAGIAAAIGPTLIALGLLIPLILAIPPVLLKITAILAAGLFVGFNVAGPKVHGFFANFFDNLKILAVWLQDTLPKIWENLGTVIVRFLKVMANNFLLGFQTVGRLAVTAIGMIGDLILTAFENVWDFVFGGGLMNAVVAGFTAVQKWVSDWALKIAEVLGELIYSVVTGDFSGITSQLAEDFSDGVNQENFGDAFKKVMSEQMAKADGLDLGDLGIKAPTLKLGTEKVEIPDEPKIEVSDPQVAGVELGAPPEEVSAREAETFSAVEAGSAEAIRQARLSETMAGSIQSQQLDQQKKIEKNTRKVAETPITMETDMQFLS